MANRRMIASDIFEDDFIWGLNYMARLLWIGLIVRCADDQGRLQDNPILIKSQIFPADDLSPDIVHATLNQFMRAGKIQRYTNDGKRLIQIINWWKYQTPMWANASRYPAPAGWIDREKYHAQGNKIAMRNWDLPGGFERSEDQSADTNPPTNPPTNPVTNPPSNPDTNPVTSSLNDVNVKGESIAPTGAIEIPSEPTGPEWIPELSTAGTSEEPPAAKEEPPPASSWEAMWGGGREVKRPGVLNALRGAAQNALRKPDLTWCPPEYLELAEAFITNGGREPCNESDQKHYNRDLKLLIEDGIPPDVLGRAVVKMRKDAMVIKSPYSCRTVALELMATGGTPSDNWANNHPLPAGV